MPSNTDNLGEEALDPITGLAKSSVSSAIALRGLSTETIQNPLSTQVGGEDPTLNKGYTNDEYKSYTDEGVTPNPWDDNDEKRAEGQGAWEQVGHGLAKAATMAVGTAAENTLGVFTGVGSMLTGDSYYNNIVGRMNDGLQTWAQKEFPNYQTADEKNANLIQNMFQPGKGVANFWADKVGNMLGFTAGSIASAYMFGLGEVGGAAGAIGKVTKTLSSGAKVAKVVDFAKQADSSLSMGLAMSSMAARSSKTDMTNQLTQNYMETNGLQSVGQIPSDVLDKIDSISTSAANVGFITNMLIASAGNVFTFKGIMMPKYSEGAEGLITGSTKRTLDDAGNATLETSLDKSNKLMTLAKAAAHGSLSEGAMLQGFHFANQWTSNFYNNKFSNPGKDLVNNMLDSGVKAATDTYGTKEGWEQFMVGAMAGAPMSAYHGMQDSKSRNEAQAKLLPLINAHPELANIPGALDYVSNSLASNKKIADGFARSTNYISDVTEAAQNKDEQSYELGKYNAFKSYTKSMLDAGGHKLLLDKLDAAKDLHDSEFAKAFGYDENSPLPDTKVAIVEKAKAEVNKLAKIHSDINTQFPDIANPKPGKEQEFQDHRTKLKDTLFDVTSEFHFLDDRENNIANEIASLAPGTDIERLKEINNAKQSLRQRSNFLSTYETEAKSLSDKQAELHEALVAHDRIDTDNTQAWNKSKSDLDKKQEKIEVQKQRVKDAEDKLDFVSNKAREEARTKVGDYNNDLQDFNDRVDKLKNQNPASADRVNELRGQLADIATRRYSAIDAYNELRDPKTQDSALEKYAPGLQPKEVEKPVEQPKKDTVVKTPKNGTQKTEETDTEGDQGTGGKDNEETEEAPQEAGEKKWLVQVKGETSNSEVISKETDPQGKEFYNIKDKEGKERSVPANDIIDPRKTVRDSGSAKQIIYKGEMLKMFSGVQSPTIKRLVQKFVNNFSNEEVAGRVRIRINKSYVNANKEELVNEGNPQGAKAKLSANNTKIAAADDTKRKAFSEGKTIVGTKGSDKVDILIDVKLGDKDEWTWAGDVNNSRKYIQLDPETDSATEWTPTSYDKDKDLIAIGEGNQVKDITPEEYQDLKQQIDFMNQLRDKLEEAYTKSGKDELILTPEEVSKLVSFQTVRGEIDKAPVESRANLATIPLAKINEKYYVFDKSQGGFIGDENAQPPKEDLFKIPAISDSITDRYVSLVQTPNGEYSWIGTKPEALGFAGVTELLRGKIDAALSEAKKFKTNSPEINKLNRDLNKGEDGFFLSANTDKFTHVELAIDKNDKEGSTSLQLRIQSKPNSDNVSNAVFLRDLDTSSAEALVKSINNKAEEAGIDYSININAFRNSIDKNTTSVDPTKFVATTWPNVFKNGTLTISPDVDKLVAYEAPKVQSSAPESKKDKVLRAKSGTEIAEEQYNALSPQEKASKEGKETLALVNILRSLEGKSPIEEEKVQPIPSKEVVQGSNVVKKSLQKQLNDLSIEDRQGAKGKELREKIAKITEQEIKDAKDQVKKPPVFSTQSIKDAKAAGHLTDESTKTSFQQGWDNLKRLLPEAVAEPQRLDTIMKNIQNSGVTWGAFHDTFIYLADSFKPGSEYHEAFHAALRLYSTDSEIDKYLASAKSDRGAVTQSEINELRNSSSKYSNLSDKVLENLVYEEHLANKFQEYMLNKKTDSTTVLARLYRGLKAIVDWVKNTFGPGKDTSVENFFADLSNGEFRHSKIQNNKFRRDGGNPMFSLFTVDSVKNDEGETVALKAGTSESNSARATIAALYMNGLNKRGDLYPGMTDDQILDHIIAARGSIYDASNPQYLDKFKATSDPGKLETDLARTKAIYTLPDNVSLLKQSVKDLLKYIDINEKLDEEDDESYSKVANERKEEFDKNAINMGGFDSLPKAIKRYISLTTIFEDDKFGNNVEVSVDPDKTYSGISRALASTERVEFMDKLAAISDTNENVKAVYNRLLVDTGYDGDSGVATKDSNFYQLFVSAFDNEKLSYLQILHDHGQDEKDKVEPKFSIFNANQKDAEHTQMDAWIDNYNLLKGRLSDKKIGDGFGNAKPILLSAISKKDGKFTITNKRVATIQDSFKSIGIDLSKGYIIHSLAKLADAAGNTLDKITTKNLNSFKDIDGLSLDDVDQLASIISKNQNPFVKEESTGEDTAAIGRLKKIARNNAMFDESVISTNFQDAHNKTRYPFIPKSFQTSRTRQLQKREGEYGRGPLYKDPFTKGNYLLNKSPDMQDIIFDRAFILSHTGDFRQAYLGDGSTIPLDNKEGVTHADGDARAFILTQIDNFANTTTKILQSGNLKGEKVEFAGVLPYVIEAKSSIYSIPLPKGEFYKDGKLTEDAKEALFGMFKQEYDRIGRAQKEIDNPNIQQIEGYHTGDKRALKLWNFKYLENDQLLSDATKGKAIDEATKSKVQDNIESHFIDQIEKYKDKLVDIGIIGRTEKGSKLTNSLLPYGWLLSHRGLNEEVDEPTIIDRAVGNFFMNDHINSQAFNELLFGDPAYYKSFADRVKRNAGAAASGRDMGRGISKVGIAEEPVIYFDKASNRVSKEDAIGDNGKTKEGITEFKIADAQALTGVNRRIDFLKSQGRYPKEVQAIYDNKITQGIEPTWDEIQTLFKEDAALNSIKTVHYDGPQYLKHSEAALIKELTSYKDKDGNWQPIRGRELLHNAREQMDNGEIDMISRPSGSKGKTPVAAPLVDGVHDFSKSTMTVENRWTREQTATPTGKTKVTVGTQLIQLIDSEQKDNTRVNFLGQDTTVGNLRKIYQDLQETVRNVDMNKAMKYLGTVEDGKLTKVDAGRLQQKFYETVENTGADTSLLEYFGKDENGQPKYNFNLPTTINKAEQLFLAHFTKGVLSQKAAGIKATLMSGWGYNPVREASTGKVITSTEYKSNPDKYNDQVKYITRELGKDKDGFYEIALPAYIRELHDLKAGDSVPDSIMKMFGIRIPTSDKHSMGACKVVDFLPSVMGSIVIAPHELVYLSGADFDVDSEFLLRKDFYTTTKNGKTIFHEYGVGNQSVDNKWNEYQRSERANNQDLQSKIKDLKTNSQFWNEATDSLDKIVENFTKVSTEDHNLRKQIGELARLKSDTDNDESVEPSKVLSDQAIQSKLEELISISTDRKNIARLYTTYKDLLSSLNSKFQAEAMKALQLPSTKEEFLATKDFDKMNNSANNNKLVESYIGLWNNEGMKEIRNTPASAERLYKIVDAISEIKGLDKDQADVNSPLGKINAFESNSAGRDNIAPIVNATLINSFLSRNDVDIKGFKLTIDKDKFNTFGDSNSYDRDLIKGEDGRYKLSDAKVISRKADDLAQSEMGATDNAKNPVASKLNQGLDNLSTLSLMKSLSIGLTRESLFSAQPIMVELSKKLKVTRYAIKTPREERLGRKNITQSMLDDLAKKVGALGKDKEIQITTKALLDNLYPDAKETNRKGSDLTDYNVLSAFTELEDQARYFTMVGQILKLNKGLPPTFEEMDTIQNAIDVLLQKGTDIDKEVKLPIDIREAVDNTPNIKSNIEHFENIQNVAGNFLLKATRLFKEFTGTLDDNLQTIIKDRTGVVNRMKTDFLSYLTLNAYLTHLDKTFGEGSRDIAANNELINPKEGDNTIVAQRKTLLENHPDLITNRFINYTIPGINGRNGLHTLESASRIKSTSPFIDTLIDSFTELLSSPHSDVRDYAINTFRYLLVKDNFQYKDKTFIKYMWPEMFKRISTSLNGLNTLLNSNNPNDEDFKNAIGKDKATAKAEFMEMWSRYTPNNDALPKIYYEQALAKHMIESDGEGGFTFDLLKGMTSYQEAKEKEEKPEEGKIGYTYNSYKEDYRKPEYARNVAAASNMFGKIDEEGGAGFKFPMFITSSKRITDYNGNQITVDTTMKLQEIRLVGKKEDKEKMKPVTNDMLLDTKGALSGTAAHYVKVSELGIPGQMPYHMSLDQLQNMEYPSMDDIKAAKSKKPVAQVENTEEERPLTYKTYKDRGYSISNEKQSVEVSIKGEPQIRQMQHLKVDGIDSDTLMAEQNSSTKAWSLYEGKQGLGIPGAKEAKTLDIAISALKAYKERLSSDYDTNFAEAVLKGEAKDIPTKIGDKSKSLPGEQQSGSASISKSDIQEIGGKLILKQLPDLDIVQDKETSSSYIQVPNGTLPIEIKGDLLSTLNNALSDPNKGNGTIEGLRDYIDKVAKVDKSKDKTNC